MKIKNGGRINKINEGVANIAAIAKINGQVHKVKAANKAAERLEQHLLRVLIRNILNHERGALIGATAHRLQVKLHDGPAAAAAAVSAARVRLLHRLLRRQLRWRAAAAAAVAHAWRCLNCLILAIHLNLLQLPQIFLLL